VTEPVIRIAGPADTPALAALRRAWTAEQSGPADDEGFEARFRDWYERESARRVTWLAEVSGEPVGMMNLAVFERMPRSGRDAGAWGYLGNAFVLAAYRNQGIGSQLMRALLAYADDRGYLRAVLSPSERSVPFYQRFGFGAGSGLLVRQRPALALPAPGSQRRQLSPLYPAGGPSCGPMTGSNAAE
jgi:GNAT superfamily N-acetyltransferase